jgi:protoporphyrinogen oxidase
MLPIDSKHVVVIGAGPAGLTAGYLLAKQGIRTTILEADAMYVGGISRTVKYKGFCFDIGGHRFFSKSMEVEALWDELLPNDMLERPRSSRIYYRNKFFAYPLRAVEALYKLGPIESSLCVLSYLKARAFPCAEPKSFEQWVSNQFGKRLFNIFFKTYTEKVWGMSCSEISADWAAQRIKGLSLLTAIRNSLGMTQWGDRKAVVKSLIDSFRYPRKGPGMLWEACAQKAKEHGAQIFMDQRVVQCAYTEERRTWVVMHQDSAGRLSQSEATDVISSAPIRQLAHGITPRLSKEALNAADSLKYRDFITVMLILKDDDRFSDNWIYIHDASVKVGRIQNFKSWSPEMVPDASMCCYGLEYFCFEGDGLWNTSDAELIEQAKSELEHIGLAKSNEVLDGCVVRQPKAYPVYDDKYAENVAILRSELAARYPTMHLVGRNGMHKYNNQDHAMMTAMLCVKNILAGKNVYDLWKVNQDAEYHESREDGTDKSYGSGLRQVPSRVAS